LHTGIDYVKTKLWDDNYQLMGMVTVEGWKKNRF